MVTKLSVLCHVRNLSWQWQLDSPCCACAPSLFCFRLFFTDFVKSLQNLVKKAFVGKSWKISSHHFIEEMENRGRSLWDENTQTPRGLRRPKTPPSHLKDDSKNISSDNDVTTPTNPEEARTNKYRLSADAPEFIPAFLRSQPSNTVAAPSPIQARLKKHKALEVESNSNENEDEVNENAFVDSADDVRLKHLIDTLTKDPGQFSDLLEIFMDTLCPYFTDFIVLSRAAQLLVDQAINFPSFRYTGARLCCHIEQYCAAFRAELHLTCQKELKKNPNKSGLLLFVAELYTQLHHENIYGSYLIEAFKHLLSLGGNENVKSVCQALKLTGSSLELYAKAALDEVFAVLNEVKPTVTGTAATLINSVINLRNSRWGHSSPVPVSFGQEPEYWGDASDTVFYNLDGSSFSTEEADFLAQHLGATEEYLDMSDPDELCDPEPEMDEEIQAAFKDFVKLSKR